MHDPVAEMRVNVKDVAGEDRSGWSGEARSDRLRDLLELGEKLGAEVIRATAEWDQAAAWGEDGQVSPVSWLVWQAPRTRAEATTMVRTARLYAKYPQIAAALAGGEISCGHVDALARIERPHPDEFAVCVEGLLDAAIQTTVNEFGWVARQWANAVDDRAPADDAKRHLGIADTFGGQSYVKGSGSNEEAAILRAALAKNDRPDPIDCPDGPRTKAQRMWDALIDMARRELQGNDPTGSPGGLDLVADAETVGWALHDPICDDVDPTLDLDPDGDATTPSSRLEDVLARHMTGPDPAAGQNPGRCGIFGGPPLPPAVIVRWLCDSWVRRVIRDPKTGHVMDYGRRQRLFNRNQRRAMAHRDGGCGFPGCDRGPEWCDAHHINPWEHDGPTDIDNGCLLCRRHHVLVHDKGWKLTRNPTTGTITATAPDGRTFTRQPRPPVRGP